MYIQIIGLEVDNEYIHVGTCTCMYMALCSISSLFLISVYIDTSPNEFLGLVVMHNAGDIVSLSLHCHYHLYINLIEYIPTMYMY